VIFFFYHLFLTIFTIYIINYTIFITFTMFAVILIIIARIYIFFTVRAKYFFWFIFYYSFYFNFIWVFLAIFLMIFNCTSMILFLTELAFTFNLITKIFYMLSFIVFSCFMSANLTFPITKFFIF